MMRRVALVVLSSASLALALRAQADEIRPAVDRPDIMEVGDPILINRRLLAREMTRNVDLRDWIRLYGAPEYSEVQEIEIDPPWAPYEVRLYYLKRNAYLAFGRVDVAPSVYDYGVRKYIGPINPAVVERLLTAQPPAPASSTAGSAEYPLEPTDVIIETTAVEGVPVSN